MSINFTRAHCSVTKIISHNHSLLWVVLEYTAFSQFQGTFITDTLNITSRVIFW